MPEHRYRTPIRGIRLEGIVEATLGPFVLKKVESQLPAVQPLDLDNDFEELEGLPSEKYALLFPRLIESLLYRTMSDHLCVIEYASDVENPEDAAEHIDQAIDILRLGELNGVTRRWPTTIPSIQHCAPGSGFYVGGASIRARWLPELVITPDNLPTLERRFAHTYPFDLGPLRSAMERFRSAYERDNTVDAFIDLLVCLESIFSDTQPVDTKYKLAMRAAHFLTVLGFEKKYVYDTMSKAYTKRSDVLHGRKNARDWVTANFHGVWNIARSALLIEMKLARKGGVVVQGAIFDDFFILTNSSEPADTTGD